GFSLNLAGPRNPRPQSLVRAQDPPSAGSRRRHRNIRTSFPNVRFRRNPKPGAVIAMSITVRQINKSFGNFHAVETVTLAIAAGHLVALLGPSGSGKTTLLRIIAGLEIPDSGTVICHGEDITHRAAAQRNVGFVFQHYALFRHMTVFENVAFGLRVRKTPN